MPLQKYDLARPSPISIWPTSRPPTVSDPHSRPKLQFLVPSVPGRQAQATRVKLGLPALIRLVDKWVVTSRPLSKVEAWVRKNKFDTYTLIDIRRLFDRLLA